MYRSHIEIAGILRSLENERSLVSADVNGGKQLYLTRIVHVDPGTEYFVIACSDEKSANAALLAEKTVVFRATFQKTRVEFSAAHPSDISHNDMAAIRLSFPEALTQVQRRRFPRYQVPGDVSLRCVADTGGFTPFEAHITDISLGGLGAMLYDAGIQLPNGTKLRGCRIVVPDHEAAVVDIEVRYTKSVLLDDGTLANRSGMRFMQQCETNAQ